MTVRFPKKRLDGSFSFVARFEIEPTSDAVEAANRWFISWVAKNRIAEIRTVADDEVTCSSLDFFTDYFSPPSAIGLADRLLLVRFDGRPNAKEWKDWFVWITKAFIDDNPYVRKLADCRNLEDGPERGPAA